MEKIKVGDYVRTKEGFIARVQNKEDDYIEFDNVVRTMYGDSYCVLWGDLSKEIISKTSPNIIDLIEVGDYVNGSVVDKLKDKIVYLGCDTPLSNEMIDTIVTKEQFEGMEFKI